MNIETNKGANKNSAFNPIPWALSIGILLLSGAAAYAMTQSCQPASFELLQFVKTEFGGCQRNDVMPAFNHQSPSVPLELALSAAKDENADPAITPTEFFDDRQAKEQGNTEVVKPADLKADDFKPLDFKPVVLNPVDLKTVDFKNIVAGNQYYLSNKITPAKFNAPLHQDQPSWGRVAPIFADLSPNQLFTVQQKVTTFSGFKWLSIEIISKANTKVNGWLPWGAIETPVIAKTNG